jgi:hypothetical protein
MVLLKLIRDIENKENIMDELEIPFNIVSQLATGLIILVSSYYVLKTQFSSYKESNDKEIEEIKNSITAAKETAVKDNKDLKNNLTGKIEENAKKLGKAFDEQNEFRQTLYKIGLDLENVYNKSQMDDRYVNQQILDKEKKIVKLYLENLKEKIKSMKGRQL